jgi:hypothetical protein
MPCAAGSSGPESPPCILSIDLACAEWQAIGVAIVTPTGAQLIEVPHRGRPTAEAVLAWIRTLLREHPITGLCIDGPLGWRAPDGGAPHCREAERAVRAPGKTGLPPDGVKPASYLGFTRFSIALFEALTMDDGWRLPGQVTTRSPTSGVSSPAPRSRFVTECFPTAIWRGLGVKPLKAKARATPADVAAARTQLEALTGLTLTGGCSVTPSHDQLQAVVGGVAGLRWAIGDPSARLAGVPPVRLDDSWREGYILTLDASPDSSSSPSAAHVSVLPS